VTKKKISISPFICSNTPSAREYGVYISQLIRYLRASFQNVLDRGMLLTRQQFQLAKLKSSLRNFYSRHLEWINSCGIYVSHMTTDMLNLSLQPCAHSCIITWFVTRVTRRMPRVEQELLTLPMQLTVHLYFSWLRVTRSLVWCVLICRSLFVLLSFSCSHCVLLQVALAYVPSVCIGNFYIRIVYLYSC
jgi:hypothetical protein